MQSVDELERDNTQDQSKETADWRQKMIYTVPDYFYKFECLAAECPETCCAGWQIVIDERTLAKYQKCQDSFGNRLANSIDWKERCYLQYDGRCAFLNEEDLCDIHLEKGVEYQCKTCRRYPKHVEIYDNEREWSLSLSCPAVARMILEKKEKTKFYTAEKKTDEYGKSCENEDEFDDFLFSALMDCRSVLIEMAQNRKEALNIRMAKILSLSHDVQNRIDARRLFDTETVLQRYQRAGADTALSRKLIWYSLVNEEFCGLTKEDRAESDELSVRWRMLDYFREFEVLDPNWVEELQRWRKALYGEGAKRYLERRACFLEQAKAWETEYEQVLVYFLYVYFCGAVYDGEALRKAKMAVVSVEILKELQFAEWIEKQEKLTVADRTRLTWRFARELEHSDPNLNAMERMMDEWKEADFEVLLLLLLQDL